jgi:branched-chain amino acid transport system substrate-binding protein
MRDVFNVLGLIILLVIFTTLVAAQVAKASPIKVGAIINLTGPASSRGQFTAKGHSDYFRYVNESKGGIFGDKIELTIIDHGYRIPEAINLVKKFCTADKMDIINTWDAASGVQAKPIFQRYGVPNINYSTYKGFLKPPIDYAYLPFGDYDMDSYAILEYIKLTHRGKEIPKVGLLTYDNLFGAAFVDPSKEYAKRCDIEIVQISQFPISKHDLKTELLRLKDSGAEYVVMQLLPPALLLALKSADQINYKVPFFATWTSTDQRFFDDAKGLLRNRLFVQFCGGLPTDDKSGVETMNELIKQCSSIEGFDFSYWQGVVIAMIEERAFRIAHKKFGKVNSKTTNQALETFRNENFGGLVPDVTYTETDHSASWSARIVRVNENQTYTPVTTFWAPGKDKPSPDIILDVPPEPPWDGK